MQSQAFQFQLEKKTLTELLGILPYEILLALRDSFPEGKNFKDLKKSVENKLQDWLSKKNKSNFFTDQAIYYQLRKLKELGFIETIAERELDRNDRLITSQKYKLTSLKYVINFSESSNKLSDEILNDPVLIPHIPLNFLTNFGTDGKFNGLIVLGSGSTDGPFVGPLSYFLGKTFVFSDFNFVFYDRKILDDPDDKNIKTFLSKNIILLGGPNVNSVFHSTVPSPSGVHRTLNEILPVRFLQAPDSGVIIQNQKIAILTKDQLIGVIQQIENPWNPNNKILTIGGPKRIGTEAAVIEFTKSFKEIDKLLLNQNYCLIEAKTDLKGQIIETIINPVLKLNKINEKRKELQSGEQTFIIKNQGKGIESTNYYLKETLLPLLSIHERILRVLLPTNINSDYLNAILISQIVNVETHADTEICIIFEDKIHGSLRLSIPILATEGGDLDDIFSLDNYETEILFYIFEKRELKLLNTLKAKLRHTVTLN